MKEYKPIKEWQMPEQPKTIQIFLPDGNARSIRIAEITSRTIHAIQVPRSKIRAAVSRSEIQNVGVYFLFGESDEDAKPKAYIGEAENCYDRICQHNRLKDFWSTAVAITSKTRAFDKAQARYLEWYFVKEATRIDRYEIENSTSPNKPYIAESTQADLLDYIGTTRVLLSTLGFPLLQDIDLPEERREKLICKIDKLGIKATGKYTEDGLVVHKGSQARLEAVQDKAKWVRNRRNKLIKSGVLEERDGAYTFTQDYIFSSPSAASQTVLGRPSNGWVQWRNRAGKTLDELERQ